MSYSYITPLEEKPKVAKRTYRVKSTAQLVIEEFLKSKVKYAEIKGDVLNDYKSPASAARGFGRVIKTLGQSENVKVYSDSEKKNIEIHGFELTKTSVRRNDNGGKWLEEIPEVEENNLVFGSPPPAVREAKMEADTASIKALKGIYKYQQDAYKAQSQLREAY